MTTATGKQTLTSSVQTEERESWLDALRRSSGALLFMAPATILVILFFFVPVIILLGLSMTNLSSATGFSNWEWIGLENYRRMFTNPQARFITLNTIKYVLLTLTFFNMGMALVVALLSTQIGRAHV